MKKLIIVESPAKIKTISKFLGKEFVIMSTMGHIKDLPTKTLGVVLNGGISIEYVTLDKKDKVIADICKAASTSDAIFLAPDPDREGEIIAWHVANEIKKVTKKILLFIVSRLTKLPNPLFSMQLIILVKLINNLLKHNKHEEFSIDGLVMKYHPFYGKK